MWNVMIKGHVLEFRISASGSIDPWTYEYCRNNGITIIGSSDIKEFVRLDNHYIYKLNLSSESEFIRKYEEEEFQTFNEIEDWLNKNAKLVKTMDQIYPEHESS